MASTGQWNATLGGLEVKSGGHGPLPEVLTKSHEHHRSDTTVPTTGAWKATW